MKEEGTGDLSSGAVWTGRLAWALIPSPVLPPSLISLTVSVDVKHRERRRYRRSELRSCVNRDWALIPYPILTPGQVKHTVSVDAIKQHERRGREWKIRLESVFTVSYPDFSYTGF